MEKEAYIISDIHLGAACVADPRAHQRAVAAWLRSIIPHASALYILGDAIDYWYEYRTVVPRGFTRFFGALAEVADSGVPVTWLRGNHDIWIFDYLPSELGITVMQGPLDTLIQGRRVVMDHGDLQGETRPSYRRMQRIFRSPLAQLLFASVHPRWTVAFAHSWSAHSRRTGAPAPTGLPDTDPLVRWAGDYMERNGHVDYFLFGHRHTAEQRVIAPGTTLAIVGDAFCLMKAAKISGGELKFIDIPSI